MGRLFWKIVLVTWIALLVAGYAVATLVRVHDESVREEPRVLYTGPRADFALNSAASLLRHGGPDALRELLLSERGESGPPLLAIDENGRELLGRPAPPPNVMGRARELSHDAQEAGPAREVKTADGHSWLLFFPGGPRMGGPGNDRPPPPGDRGPPGRTPDRGPPFPWVPLIAGVLGSLAASALLAWYLSRPVRVLREAFDAAAGGRLDTRIQARMGGRRDEIADLGRDFDHMAARLESLIGAQRRLLHDVSHELRSPLARLQVAIGLARQNPRKLEATLDRVERESARLDELVGELLTLSRLDTGATTAAGESFDLAAMLETIAGDARFEGKATGRDVTCTTPAALPMCGNEELLHRAFENVVRNALKYTPAGGRVEIELQRASASIKVLVCDGGPGVPSNELEAIFEPFYRAQNTAGQGTGLGLAIAQRAIRLHGGSITARNRNDGGLCVEISLPTST